MRLNKIIRSNLNSNGQLIKRYESENLLEGQIVELTYGEAAIITINGRIYKNGILTEAGHNTLNTGNAFWTRLPFMPKNNTQLFFIRTHNMPIQPWCTKSNTYYSDPGANGSLAEVRCKGTYSWKIEGAENIMRFINSGIITGGLNALNKLDYKDINELLTNQIGEQTIPAIAELTKKNISLRQINAHNLKDVMQDAVKRILLDKYGIALNEFNIQTFDVVGSKEWETQQQLHIEGVKKKMELWYVQYKQIYEARGKAAAIKELGHNWQFMEFIGLLKSMSKNSTPGDINNFVNSMLGQQTNGFATALQTLMSQGSTAGIPIEGGQTKGLPNHRADPSLLEPLTADERTDPMSPKKESILKEMQKLREELEKMGE